VALATLNGADLWGERLVAKCPNLKEIILDVTTYWHFSRTVHYCPIFEGPRLKYTDGNTLVARLAAMSVSSIMLQFKTLTPDDHYAYQVY
jgi:hypothetical protein